ncbi:MAG: HD domain-containing protein [Lachnospiraceae bacterium]|nr:HD domain-containing protein [Lachnospiraceae bacterium]
MSKKWIFMQAFMVITLIAWLIAMNVYVNIYNSKEFTYTMGTESDEYAAKMVITKHWNETAHGYGYGMQYDAKFENNTPSTLYDWSADITLIDGCQLEDFWNGEMTLEDNVIHLNPDEDIATIAPNSNRTFGFILYSQKLNNVQDFVISYHMKIELKDLPLFTWWEIALMVFAVFEVIVIATYLRTWRIKKKQKEFESIVHQSFQMFANLIDAKDAYTSGHSLRVAWYSKELAKRMGIAEEERNRLYYIALLHDIGKIGIADAILNKNGKLTPEERSLIEKHVTIGGDILKDFTALKGIAEGARYHHERYDGKGYVSGLKGEEIPLFARIIAVADSFDAMSSERCYRPKLEMSVIIDELKKGSGTQFDPKIAVHMLDMIEDDVVPINLAGI